MKKVTNVYLTSYIGCIIINRDISLSYLKFALNSGGREIVCQIQLEFAIMNHLKMLYEDFDVMFLEVAHYLNIVNVNFMKSQAFDAKRSLKQLVQELKGDVASIL